MWNYAVGGFRLVAGLIPSLDSLAARLRLDTERSWEDGLGRGPQMRTNLRLATKSPSQTPRPGA
jgi:hypothetical protein